MKAEKILLYLAQLLGKRLSVKRTEIIFSDFYSNQTKDISYLDDYECDVKEQTYYVKDDPLAPAIEDKYGTLNNLLMSYYARIDDKYMETTLGFIVNDYTLSEISFEHQYIYRGETIGLLKEYQIKNEVITMTFVKGI